MKLLDIIRESNDRKHEYGAVLIRFDFPEVHKIHDAIDPNDIYEGDGFGLETEPHVTLLFGLHEGVSDDTIKQILNKYTFDACRLENPSIFENQDYDVLKYDVVYATRGGAFLHKINKELRELPHTNEFPEYHPHMTIAYLNPHTGKRYVNMLKNSSFTFTPKYAVYSKMDGSHIKMPIHIR